MQKVLVAGASGSLGFEVLKMLKGKAAKVSALVRSSDNFNKLKPYTEDVLIADAGNSEEMECILKGFDVVFSAIGQSVSLFAKGGSFEDIDYGVNANLINASVEAGIKRFVYISIKGADSASNLLMANAHKRVEDLLKVKDLNYTVIRPVGLFSGFHDWLAMGKKGIIPVPGPGTHKTNPIHQKDLAKVVVDNLFKGSGIIEAGGPEVYTRIEIAQMIHEKTGGKLVYVPEMLIDPGLFFLKYVDDNIQAKLDYFKYVSVNDMIAPEFGKISFREYISDLDLNNIPDVW